MPVPVIQPVGLPDRFYLPNAITPGARDVVPWRDARSYVSDGTRFGLLHAGGAVVWLDSADHERLRAGYTGEEYDLYWEALGEYLAYRTRLRELWQEAGLEPQEGAQGERS